MLRTREKSDVFNTLDEIYLVFTSKSKYPLCTAAFTYYYDPAILRNKLTPLSIFRDPALRKRDSKKIIIYFCVFYRVYTNIPKLYGLLVYSIMDFLGRCMCQFWNQNSVKS